MKNELEHSALSMINTSFGKMSPILKIDNKIITEYLIFEKEGRKHKHLEYESFTVLSGTGVVMVGDKTFKVEAGDTVTIPPNTDHWMIPHPETKLVGLLWYHQTKGQTYF
jgi:mannose-6-phosphate isomerase-like protein (cupin superfamily)